MYIVRQLASIAAAAGHNGPMDVSKIMYGLHSHHCLSSIEPNRIFPAVANHANNTHTASLLEVAMHAYITSYVAPWCTHEKMSCLIRSVIRSPPGRKSITMCR